MLQQIDKIITEYDRVLEVFWSKIPLSRTHERYLLGKRELEKYYEKQNPTKSNTDLQQME